MTQKPNGDTKQHKKLLYNQTRTTTIKNKEGPNTPNIASRNPDFFATNEIQSDIIQQITMNKVHIASIQETKIPQNHAIKNQNYTIITS